MIDRFEYKKRALLLRKQGLSYKEIQAFIPVSKGLLSTWFNDLVLTPVEQKFLEERIAEKKQRGRLQTLISNKSRRLERERILVREAEERFAKKVGDPGFIFGIISYWAAGSKEGGMFQFMSTDTDMVFLMFAWIRKYLEVPIDKIGFRIFAHSLKEFEMYRDFWAKRLDLSPQFIKKSLYRATKRESRAHPDYKGCIRLTLGSVRYLRMMKAWQKLVIEYYGKALLRG
jgi:hypothetical protein